MTESNIAEVRWCQRCSQDVPLSEWESARNVAIDRSIKMERHMAQARWAKDSRLCGYRVAV